MNEGLDFLATSYEVKINDRAFSKALSQLKQKNEDAAARNKAPLNQSLCIPRTTTLVNTVAPKIGHSISHFHNNSLASCTCPSCPPMAATSGRTMGYSIVSSKQSTERSVSPQNPNPIPQVVARMDYAKKQKLLEKRRELTERAKKVLHGKQSSTSTSIMVNKKDLNFNDVLKMEKE